MRVVQVLSFLAFTSVLLAQGEIPGRFVGMVRTPGGEPLAEARVQFFPAASSGYPWLSPLLPLPGHTTSISDQRGRFELTCSGVRGSLWIEHPDGLGGLFHGLAPGAARVLSTEPLGELRLASNTTFGAEIRVLLAAGESVYLGHRQGDALRLPTGSYLLLITSEGHRHEVSARVRSGEKLVVKLPITTNQEVMDWSTEDGELYLDGWPMRLQIAKGRMILPQPAERARLRWHRPLIAATWIEELWYEPGGTLWLPSRNVQTRTVRVIDQNGRPLRDVRVCAIEQASAQLRVQSMGLTDAKGSVDLASPLDDGESYLVAILPGYGPAVRPAVRPDHVGSAGEALRLLPGSHARLRVLDARGIPLPGTRVEIRQQPESLLHQISYSNARGEVHFMDLIDGAAQLRIDHADFLLVDLPIRTHREVAGAFPTLQLEPGLELSGQIVNLGEQPVHGAVVELRGDGAFTKTLATDPAGRFLFRGLPDARFTIFAHTIVEGITWSGRASGLTPGQDQLRIVVSSEDPPLPSKK